MIAILKQFAAEKMRALYEGQAERVAVRAIVILFFYAIATAYIGKDAQPELLEQMSGANQYNGMLLRTARGYDFFDFTPMNFDEKRFDISDESTAIKKDDSIWLPISTAELASDEPQTQTGGVLRFGVLGPHLLLANDGYYARVYDTNDKKTYDLIREPGMETVTYTTRKDVLFTTLETNGDYSLRYFFANCKEPEILSLRGADVSAKATLEALQLPTQKEIILSPSQVYAAVIDHDFQSRVRIVNLISREITELRYPDMGEGQIHFSPSFVGDDKVAFSAMDGDRYATVLYSVQTGSYDVISDGFSDAIYVSRTGIVTLLQSFHQLAGNVPFGSLRLIQDRFKIPRSDITALFGDDEDLWRRIFVDPNADFLQFKDDAEQRFKIIEDPVKRHEISRYWANLYDPFVPKELEQKILRVQGLGTEHVASMSYFVTSSEPFLTWNMDMSMLLENLGFPTSVIDDYRAKLAQNPESYSLQSLR